jgi:hypothetical protein
MTPSKMMKMQSDFKLINHRMNVRSLADLMIGVRPIPGLATPARPGRPAKNAIARPPAAGEYPEAGRGRKMRVRGREPCSRGIVKSEPFTDGS